MKIEEGLTFDITWEELRLLPKSEDILEDIVSWYEFVKSREISRDEMIEMMNRDPIHGEVVVYGIHGLMLHLSYGDFYWNVFTLEEAQRLLQMYANV